MPTFIRALPVMLAFAALTACGGGGGGVATIPDNNPPVIIPPTPTPPPVTISLSAANLSDGRNYRFAEFNINYGLAAINADAAYQRGYFGQGATVAVVDTGVLASHVNLAGNILTEDAIRIDGNGMRWRDNTGLDDPVSVFTNADGDIVNIIGSHGTDVAGIIAGLMNDAADNPSDRDTAFFGHGVAPSASILPIRFSDTRWASFPRLDGRYTVFPLNGRPDVAFDYAVERNVHIINNSWGNGNTYHGHYGGDTTRTLAFEAPIFPALLRHSGIRNDIITDINRYERTFRDEDIAVVWAAGNDRWNSINGSIRTYEVPNYLNFYIQPRPREIYTPQQLMDNFVAVEITPNGATISVTFDDPNGFGDYALAPIYHPNLLGRWLAVVATDHRNSIAWFSNGCGRQGKYWCLAAPGVSITSAYARDINYRRGANGTSFAAPHVSGALALLKSRLPDVPMSVLVAILLNTATDIGEPGIDDVYGHGLVNIAAAITEQNNIRLITAAQPNTPAPPANGNFSLPPPDSPNGINYRANAEFNLNWGLRAINADAAYRRGYWGQGATIGIVDSGIRTSHYDLSVNIVPGRAFDSSGMTITGAGEDPNGHGTHVAGIAGGIRDDQRFHGVAPLANIMPLRISDDEGEFVLSENISAAFRYAIDNNVRILNNSWGVSPAVLQGANTTVSFGADSNAYAFRMPWTEAALAALPGGDGIRAGVSAHLSPVGDNDVAVVFAAGNDRWNGTASTLSVCYDGFDEAGRCRPHARNRTGDNPADIINHYVISAMLDNDGNIMHNFAPITLSAPLTTTVNGSRITLTWESSSTDAHALAPVWHPQLRGRWLAVVATDRDNNLAGFSNGCGEKAKWWCIAAPGVAISSSSNGGDENMIANNGTSQAAPHVSGALALLKSRLPNVPMSVLVHLLLTTATDLGAPGVDDVYGHGLVNLSAAITMQGNITLASQGVLLQNANTELPSSFAGFAKRLNGVGVAAEYLDGFYYDAPLGGMIKAQGKAKPPLDFAAGMFGIDETINDDGVFALSQNGALQAAGWQNAIFQLRHNFYNKPSLWQGEGGDITRRPFFANDGGYSDEVFVNIGDNFQLFAARGEEQQAAYSQTGIQWHRQLSSIPKLRLAAAHSNITEDNTLLGGKFGGLMPLTDGGNIRQTDIGGSYALDKRWRLFGNYQRADINAKLGGIVGNLSGVVAAGWSGGFAANNWLRKGDNFRIGIGKATRITGGEVVLNINQSSNPQKDQSTQAIRNRGYETKQQRIGLSQQTPLYLNAGYIFAPGDNSQLAIALNYYRHSPSAISIEWQWDF